MSKSFSNVTDVSPESDVERKGGSVEETTQLAFPQSTSPPLSPSSLPTTNRFSSSAQEKLSRFDKFDRHSFPSKKNSPFSHTIPHFSKKKKEKRESQVGGGGEREIWDSEIEEMGKEFCDSVWSHFDWFEPGFSQFSAVCYLFSSLLHFSTGEFIFPLIK